MGWIVLGGFLAYWFLLKHRTTQDLVHAIQNELSGFRATNEAGLPTGAVQSPTTHASFPGAVSYPLGITTAQPGSKKIIPGLNAPLSGNLPAQPINPTVPTRSPFGVPVGTLRLQKRIIL
jgi:hypothetical protein